MKWILIVVALISISGCSLFHHEPMADTHIGESGHLVMSDTAKNWQTFKEMVDFRVLNELSGKRPEAGKESWTEFWSWLISAQGKGRENSTRYISYIVETRRANGLPELP